MKIMQVRATDVAQLDVFEVRPYAFVWIQVGGVAGQLLQAQPLGTTLRQEVLDGSATMDGLLLTRRSGLTGTFAAARSRGRLPFSGAGGLWKGRQGDAHP